jgi:hypothetical protein
MTPEQFTSRCRGRAPRPGTLFGRADLTTVLGGLTVADWVGLLNRRVSFFTDGSAMRTLRDKYVQLDGAPDVPTQRHRRDGTIERLPRETASGPPLRTPSRRGSRRSTVGDTVASGAQVAVGASPSDRMAVRASSIES